MLRLQSVIAENEKGRANHLSRELHRTEVARESSTYPEMTVCFQVLHDQLGLVLLWVAACELEPLTSMHVHNFASAWSLS